MGDEDESETTYVVQYLDGHKESAAWVSRAGRCEVTYANGDRFEGRFDGKRLRQGQGAYSWTDESGRTSTYRGGYKDGAKDGAGRLQYGNGDEYQGLWSSDLRQGPGTYRFANGDVFSGQWVKDKKQGAGAYVFDAPESQLVGFWAEDKFVKGKWVMPDLSSYHGSFKDGLPVGAGVFFHRSGLAQAGVFEVELGEGEDENGGEAEEKEPGAPPAPRRFVGGKVGPADAEEFNMRVDEAPEEKGGGRGPEAGEDSAGEDSAAVVSEKGALERVFDAVDANGDCSVDIQELVEALTAGSGEEHKILMEEVPHMCNAEIHKSVKDVDTDGDGKLSLDEFTQYFYAVKLFKLTDGDNSGHIRHCELRAALIANPDRFPVSFSASGTSRVATSALITAGDKNDDRLLSFPEFVHLIFNALPRD